MKSQFNGRTFNSFWEGNNWVALLVLWEKKRTSWTIAEEQRHLWHHRSRKMAKIKRSLKKNKNLKYVLCLLGDGHEWSLLHLKVSFVWPQQWGLGLGAVIMGNVMAARRDVCIPLPVSLGTHGCVGAAFCTSESQNEGRREIVSFWSDSNMCLWCGLENMV